MSEKILKDLVKFNTINDKENILIMEYIKSYLTNLGFKCKLLGDDRKILYATIKNEQNFCFIGHTDTVSCNNDFGTNPFELVRDNTYLYGLGICDMKGGIACILDAVGSINFDELKYGITLIFTYGEEIDFAGIKYFVNSGVKYPSNILIGEPTNNVANNGSKGALAYKFKFYGDKDHSSRVRNSSNENCVIFLNHLLKLKKYFEKESCDEYEFVHTTMNYGIINGGDKINGVSDYTEATCDFRITKSIKEYKHIKQYVSKIAKKYNVEYEIVMDFLPFYTEKKEIIELYENITNCKCGKFFGLSEASAIKGDIMILGPGPITAHQNGEHISIASLNKTVEQYKKIIIKICGGNTI